AEDGIRDYKVTGVQTCALPISINWPNTIGATAHATFGPVDTKPNTLPNEPGGVTARTIRSRDGIWKPIMKPARPSTSVSARTPRSEERRVGKEGSRRSTEDRVK